MAIRYYRLFALLEEKNMQKTDLLQVISSPTLAKLSKGENINTDIIDKICVFLKCQPADIMESYTTKTYTDPKSGKEYTTEVLTNWEELEDFNKELSNTGVAQLLVNAFKTALGEDAYNSFAGELERVQKNVDKFKK